MKNHNLVTVQLVLPPAAAAFLTAYAKQMEATPDQIVTQLLFAQSQRIAGPSSSRQAHGELQHRTRP